MEAWLTRDEAAKALGRSVRTVDRLLTRGVLVRLPDGAGTRITADSVEALARRTVRPPAVATVTLDVTHYDALLDRSKRLDLVQQQLLTWEGERAAQAARTAALEAELAAKTAELAMTSDELQAERSRGFFSRLFGLKGKTQG